MHAYHFDDTLVDVRRRRQTFADHGSYQAQSEPSTMSTESTFHNHDTDLADGRLHSLPCPSPEHEGEPGNHDLLVRFAASVTVRGAASGVWLLRCWSSLCSYDSIAESLGIDLPRVRGSVARLLPYLAAVHDNDGGWPGPPRIPEYMAGAAPRSHGQVRLAGLRASG